MRDPGELYTKRGTPWIVIITRAAFLLYFVYSFIALYRPPLPHSKLNFIWLLYLIGLYLLAERFYLIFQERKIDMTFAFPLLFTVFLLNLTSMLLGGQERLPQLNRLEHFATFILLAYVISVFFSEYLPQRVWREHPYYTAFLVMAITSLFGVTNEVIELLFDTLFDTQHVGPQYDTSLDLLMNMLGSGLFIAVWLVLRVSKTS
ncbi:MAG: hypothetical protein WEA04_02240 [Candidatus Andersenbacteria bacterium]